MDLVYNLDVEPEAPVLLMGSGNHVHVQHALNPTRRTVSSCPAVSRHSYLTPLDE